MILLDTCTLLWLVSQQNKLSKKAKEIIAKHSEELFVSSITAFEIAIKSKKGKIELPIPPDKWFDTALEFHGIFEIEIDSKIAFKSVLLLQKHNDPCDRFIIATALHHSIPVLTCDKNISQYNEVKVIW